MNEMERRVSYRGWTIRYESGIYTATCGAATLSGARSLGEAQAKVDNYLRRYE